MNEIKRPVLVGDNIHKDLWEIFGTSTSFLSEDITRLSMNSSINIVRTTELGLVGLSIVIVISRYTVLFQEAKKPAMLQG